MYMFLARKCGVGSAIKSIPNGFFSAGHECYLFEDSRTIFEGTYVNLVWNCPSLFDCLLECQV